jgi:phage gp29-like protein
MAKILQLGISNGPVPTGIETGTLQPQVTKAASAPERPDVAEYGASGTPIFGGFLRERGEYNPDLVGLAAVSTYEQMRRSDAQVWATLTAIKLPILGATWAVKVDDDASAIEKEAGEYVEQCLFKDLDFSSVIRNALLELDFGFAVHEHVWEIVGNRVHLAKLAPRLPITAYRWIVDESGENLAALEQMGYRGSEYIVVQVPAGKMDLFTFNQEGQNYTGLSLLRAMYQHWYIKSNLYKVDAIACERNGMGVPTIVMGDDVKREDRIAATEWVQQLVAHQKTGLVLPKGWQFKLEGVTGTLRDPKEAIAHHNTAISMAGLAMFMMLGQSEHGSRSLGATMADFFFMSLEATSRQIARVMNLGCVKRLVDYNFPGVTNYPQLVPQQILTLKFEAIVEALNKLAQFGVVEPDDELESWLREKMGAPEIDLKTRHVVTQPATPQGEQLAQKTITGATTQGAAKPNAGGGGKSAPAAPGKTADGTKPVDPPAEGGDGGVDPQSGNKVPSRKDVEAAAQIIRQAMGENVKLLLIDAQSLHIDGAIGSSDGGAGPTSGASDFYTPGGLPLKRAPRGAEKHLALDEIIGTLDKGRNDVAAALRGARPRIQTEIVHKLADSPVHKAHRVSIPLDEKLKEHVEGILRGVHTFGREQVGKERARQLAGKGVPNAAKIRMSDRNSDQIGLFADGVVSEFQNNLQQRAANAALDRQRQGELGKGELINAIGDDLDDQSDKWIDGVASKGSNEAFAEGRQAGYEDYKDEIGSVIYSALLDQNTCDTCSDADGQEGATPDDVPDVPNPDCDGGDKCRCVQVFVFKDEEAAAA